MKKNEKNILKNVRALSLALFLGLFALSAVTLKSNSAPAFAGESIYDSSFEDFLFENKNTNFGAYFGSRENSETNKVRFTKIERNGAEKSIEMYYLSSSLIPISEKISLSETENEDRATSEGSTSAKRGDSANSALSEKQKDLIDNWKKQLLEIEASSSAVREKLIEIEKDALKALLEIKKTTSLPEVTSKNGKSVLKQKEAGRGVDLLYSILPQRGIKGEIVINSLDSYDKTINDCAAGGKSDKVASFSAILDSNCPLPPNAFSFVLRTENGIGIRKSPDGVWYFVDENQSPENSANYLYNFEKPWAKDGRSKKIKGLRMTINKVDIEEPDGAIEPGNSTLLQKFLSKITNFRNAKFEFGNYYLLTVTLPTDWLLSPERAFPITIEQSIVSDNEIKFQKGVLEDVAVGESGELSLAKIEKDGKNEGLFTGDPIDLGRDVITLDSVRWEESATKSAKVTVETRSSPDKNSWEDWVAVKDTIITNSTYDQSDFLEAIGKIASRPRRYLQYRFRLENSNPEAASPIIRNIWINFSEKVTGSVDEKMRHGKFFSEGVRQSLWWVGK